MFELNYTGTPGSLPKVKRKATFESLDQSLQNAFSLGQIGDQNFVNQLMRVLDRAEKKSLEGKKRPAINQLEHFIRRLERASKNEPDEEDDEEDKNEPAIKKFVSTLALTQLMEEAQSLIEQLSSR